MTDDTREFPPSRHAERFAARASAATGASIEREGVVLELPGHGPAQAAAAGPSLRCVSSGYMSGGCSCERTVSEHAVTLAWSAERARDGRGDRFFQFLWRGETWVGYGLADGTVRGVYCPAHRAAREARTAGCEAQHYAPVAASAGS